MYLTLMKPYRPSGILTVFLAVVFAGYFLLGTPSMTGQGALQGENSLVEFAVDQLDGPDDRAVTADVVAIFPPRNVPSFRYSIKTAFRSGSLSGQGIHATGPPSPHS